MLGYILNYNDNEIAQEHGINEDMLEYFNRVNAEVRVSENDVYYLLINNNVIDVDTEINCLG